MLHKGSIYGTNPPRVLEGIVTGALAIRPGILVVQRRSATQVNVNVWQANSYETQLDVSLSLGQLAIVTDVLPEKVLTQAVTTSAAEPNATRCQLEILSAGDILESETDFAVANEKLTPTNQSTVGAATYTKQIDIVDAAGDDVEPGFWFFLTEGTAKGQIGLISVKRPNGGGDPASRMAFAGASTFSPVIGGSTRGYGIPAVSGPRILGISSDFQRFRLTPDGAEPRLRVRGVERVEVEATLGDPILLGEKNKTLYTGLSTTNPKGRFRVIL